MEGAVVYLDFEVYNFVAGKEAVLGCALNTLVDRGDIFLGNGAADGEVFEYVARTGFAGKKVYLATNPVFPRCATMNRIRWAGLDASDFRVITTYEDCVYCKPNPDYFRMILEQFRLDPEECLMVGNDVEEDLSIRSLGVKTFLVTDTMENKKNLPVSSEYAGTLDELLKFVESVGE